MNTRGRAKSIRDAATLQEDNATLYVEEESLAGGSSSVVAVKEDVDEEEQEPTAVSEKKASSKKRRKRNTQKATKKSKKLDDEEWLQQGSELESDNDEPEKENVEPILTVSIIYCYEFYLF